VIREQTRVVHLIDVVTGEDQHVTRPGLQLVQKVDVLPDGIGGPPIPELPQALLSGHILDELAERVAQVTPSAADVPGERDRLVLG